MSSGPLPFSLRQLQYAIAVAEELSFRKAALRCHVSQPALSAQLALLEESLGARLFERNRRRVLVTSAGRELIEHARRVLQGARDLVDAGRRAGDPLAGTLRLGVIPTISPYLLPSAARRLHAAFERATFAWLEDKTAVLAEGIERGTLDAAIVALEAELGPVEAARIATDPFLLAAVPGHPLARRRARAGATELEGQSILLLDEGHCFREQALSYCSAAGARELAFRATSLATLVQMVASGTGVTLLPELAVATETRRAELCLRRFAPPVPSRTIALVWRRRSPLAAALRRVAAEIRDAYPRPPSAGAIRRPSRSSPRGTRA